MVQGKKKIRSHLWMIILIIVIVFFIFDLVFDVLFPIAKFKPLSYWSRITCYYAYFTTESNYLVLIYFIVNLFGKVKNNHTKIKFEWGLALVVYITITMFIYWSGLALNFFNPTNPNDEQISTNLAKLILVYRWFATTTLHVVVPIFMICFYLVNICGKETYSLKTHHHFWLWILELYPLLYVVFAMIRGEIRVLLHQPSNTWYPYEFFNYRHFTSGLDVAILCGFIFLILGMCMILQYFYLWINNFLFKKRHHKKNDVII